MDEQLKKNLTSRHHWLRLIFMVLFALILQVAALVMWAVVGLQFLWALITGQDNDQLRRFGHSLSTYIFEALQFLTYNTERKPFPFAEWPDLPPSADEVSGVAVVNPNSGVNSNPGAVDDDVFEETREVVEGNEHLEADDQRPDGPHDGDKR